MKEDKCIEGCNVFYGGEIKHHKDCDFYPESLTELYDNKDQQMETLLKGLRYLHGQKDAIHPDILQAYIRDLLDQIHKKV